MSFGVSVTDFVTLADKAHQLYVKVYKVAKTAPDELRGLDKELASLSSSLRLLADELDEPLFTICRAGPDRIRMVSELEDDTQQTLEALEQFAQKHDIIRTPDQQRSKFKKSWDRLRFVKDVSSIDRLRAKLVYRYSVMQLLLTSTGNSSLERMHSEQAKMSQTMHEIKSLVTRPQTLPTVSGVEKADLAASLFPMLLQKAEDHASWLLIGLDAWIQVGRWWFMKSYHNCQRIRTGSRVPARDYMDLIKASWILVDIIDVHPQRDFAHGAWCCKMKRITTRRRDLDSLPVYGV